MRKGVIQDTLTMLWDITDEFWQVGVVVSLIFAVLSFLAFRKVKEFFSGDTIMLQAFSDSSLSYILYVGPLLLLFFSYVFAVKAYSTFNKY